MAIPGSIVGVGKLVTPGGAQGPLGGAGPTGPAGSTGPAGPAGPTAVSTDAGNQAILGSDSKIYVPVTGGSSRAFFNAIGNPNFEVDQRKVGALVPLGNTNIPVMDRWQATMGSSAMRHSSQQLATNVKVPGTNFYITSKIWRIALTTAQASLAAGDFFMMYQVVEGPLLRELMGDVTSVSMLVRSSVANLKFGFSITDSGINYTLTKLCTLGAANTWTMVQMPNLPIWTPSGTYSLVSGTYGYAFQICLAGGSAMLVSANDAWVSSGGGVGFAARGQDNFASKPVNSTFDIAFIQHEPGSLCTTFQDKPFNQNLDECLRYYQKTYPYGTAAGATGANGLRGLIGPYVAAVAYGPVQFFKPMAKAPITTLYNHVTGAINSVADGGGVNHASAAALGVADSGFYGINFTTAVTAAMPVYCHYTADADTGW